MLRISLLIFPLPSCTKRLGIFLLRLERLTVAGEVRARVLLVVSTNTVDSFLLLRFCFVFLFGVFLFCTKSDAISLLNGFGPCVTYLHPASLCDLFSGPCTDKWQPARAWMEPGRGSCVLARRTLSMFVVSCSRSYELQLNKTDYFITQHLLFWHTETKSYYIIFSSALCSLIFRKKKTMF